MQLRDKTSETSELIRIGKQLHEITRKHKIPLIINDRADVALAVGAEGLHIGQDDMGESYSLDDSSSLTTHPPIL